MFKKIAFGSVGLLLLASPLLASAQTADDYGTAAGGYCPDLSTTFVRGATDASTNGQVTELQRFLTDYYNLPEEGLVTGYFWRNTEAAVIRFQKEHGLPSFGIVGSLTRAKIASVCGSGAVGTDGNPAVTLTTNGHNSSAGTVTFSASDYITNVWTTANADSVSGKYTSTGCTNTAYNATNAPWPPGGTGMNLGLNGTSGGPANPWAGCTTVITVTAKKTTTNATQSANVTNYVTPLSTAAPTLTLTTNGQSSATYNTTDTITNAWNSTGGTSWSGTYTMTNCSNSSLNVTNQPWGENKASGTSGGSAAPYAGCDTTITFTATNSAGSVSKTITNHVNAATANTTSSISVTSGNSTNSRVVNAQFSTNDCSALTVDWGDGTTDTVQLSSSQCGSTMNVQEGHIYSAYNTYTIKLLKAGTQLSSTSYTAAQTSAAAASLSQLASALNAIIAILNSLK